MSFNFDASNLDNAFNFDNMLNGLKNNPFDEKSRFDRDDRFYVLDKDDNGVGAAIIAFLPDKNGTPIQKVYKINTTITKDGKKRFAAEWSPTTIGLPCPFQEKWQELYNTQGKDAARPFARTQRYIANIKVIKDPANPANEGKVFLYDMSHTMFNKLKDVLCPSDADIALGAERKEIFNPMKGIVFQLKCVRGANGLISYDSSSFKDLGGTKTIYGDIGTPEGKEAAAQACIKDINENTYDLSEFMRADAYKSYDELKEKLNWVLGISGAANQVKSAKIDEEPSAPEINAAPDVAPAVPKDPDVSAPAKSAADSVDDLLAGII